MWEADNITSAYMLFYPLYSNIISLKGLKITQVFHLLLGFNVVTEHGTEYYNYD